MHFIWKKNFIQKNYNYARKGQFPKLKGAICNIPTDISDVTNDLPHSADSNGQINKKLSFRGHVCFSPVSPESIYLALSCLKVKNPYYKDY